MNLRALLLLSFLLSQTGISLKAQLFELSTGYDRSRYSFTFSDGFYPVTFGVSSGSGSINFNVPDATEIMVPDDWITTNYEGGFKVAYDGAFEIYPLGFENVEISFFSDYSISEIGNTPEKLTGFVVGPVVLENGYAQGILLEGGGVITAPVGYQSFYYDMPAYEGPQLTAQNLIDLYGFTLEGIRPIAADIELDETLIRITLENIIDGATYMLQYKDNMGISTWVNIRTFTVQDLDANNSITQARDGLSGFFQISIL